MALTYISKAQYNKIKADIKNMTISEMMEAYGVGFPIKFEQMMIVDIVEQAYKAHVKCYGYKPASTDVLYEFLVEDNDFVLNNEQVTLWAYYLDSANDYIDKLNARHGLELPMIQDNALTQAIAYTMIKARIGDWEE